MRQVFMKGPEGWTYYVARRFAWFPTYCQGQLVWLWFYWMTWPEKADGKPVMASDVLSPADMASMMGRDEQMYISLFPRDPRRDSEKVCQPKEIK